MCHDNVIDQYIMHMDTYYLVVQEPRTEEYCFGRSQRYFPIICCRLANKFSLSVKIAERIAKQQIIYYAVVLRFKGETLVRSCGSAVGHGVEFRPALKSDMRRALVTSIKAPLGGLVLE